MSFLQRNKRKRRRSLFSYCLLLLILLLTGEIELPHELGSKYYLVSASIDFIIVLSVIKNRLSIELLALLLVSVVVNLIGYEMFITGNIVLYDYYLPTMQWLYWGCLTSVSINILRNTYARESTNYRSL